MKKRLSRMLATILTFCGPAMMLTSCIDDTFSTDDHVDACTIFLMTMLNLKGYGSYFNWISGL